MKLYIRQKVFSWRDRFSIFDERGEPIYEVEGELFTWGRKLHVSDNAGAEAIFIQQRVWSWRPRYQIFIDGAQEAEVVRELTFFKPCYSIEGPGWYVEGDFWGHDYSVLDGSGEPVVTINKEWLTWGDCYTLDVPDPANAVLALGVVLAIDAVTADSAAASSSN